MKTIPFPAMVLALFCFAQAGCQHYGPHAIVTDRIPYNEAIALSWKEQTLLDIVKLRYMDTPFFLDFFGTPLVIEPSPGQLSSDAGLLPIRQFDGRVGLTRAFTDALEDPRDPDLTEQTADSLEPLLVAAGFNTRPV
jgi:hypothetical protein